MIPSQAMLMHPMLTHTFDATASLGAVMPALAIAAIVCGAVLVVLGYNGHRSGSAAPAAADVPDRSTASSLNPRTSGLTRQAA